MTVGRKLSDLARQIEGKLGITEIQQGWGTGGAVRGALGLK